MWPLPIGDLFFAGKSTVKKLNSLGIFTIGDLAKTDKYVIVQAMKKHGEVLWRYANGLDDSPVEPVRPDNTPTVKDGIRKDLFYREKNLKTGSFAFRRRIDTDCTDGLLALRRQQQFGAGKKCSKDCT